MKNFLGKKGLTSSEANHVTNIIKEMVKGINPNNLTLTTKTVRLDNIDYCLDENKAIKDWDKNIIKVGQLFSLSAWLKRAIKEKEKMIDTISGKPFVSVSVLEELEPCPKMVGITFDDFLNTLNTKDLSEYLSAEALASHIGKFIHNFDKIREELDLIRPTEFMKVDDKTAIVKVEKLYSKEDLLSGFFDLQNSHREAERVVNYYKAAHKEWAKNIEIEHTSLVDQINDRNEKRVLKHRSEVAKEKGEFYTKMLKDKSEISALKIIIPNELQSLLDEVKSYDGK